MNPSLLVAIMFVTILSMGIGNVLTCVAEIVRAGNKARPAAVHTSWIALLLVMHLSLFWQTVDLLAVSKWSFIGFVGVIAGPIVLFFATSVLTAGQPDFEVTDRREYYWGVARKFFLLFAGIQLWSVFVDLGFGRVLGMPALMNGLLFLLAVGLVWSRHYKVHAFGAALGWAVGLSSLVLKGIGLIS